LGPLAAGLNDPRGRVEAGWRGHHEHHAEMNLAHALSPVLVRKQPVPRRLLVIQAKARSTKDVYRELL
jgi:hypothetical protein